VFSTRELKASLGETL